MRMNGKLWALIAVATLPALTGATCSTNTVAQTAATTFFNTLITQAVTAFFAGLP